MKLRTRLHLSVSTVDRTMPVSGSPRASSLGCTTCMADKNIAKRRLRLTSSSRPAFHGLEALYGASESRLRSNTPHFFEKWGQSGSRAGKMRLSWALFIVFLNIAPGQGFRGMGCFFRGGSPNLVQQNSIQNVIGPASGISRRARRWNQWRACETSGKTEVHAYD